ncbi:WW domain-binding protein 4 [Fasciola hepatica]|uniref:WW domain-binding protein 4 n=1 Tax=Fasciola hepatica TaxID=6192 RepID=A0A4E0RH09_FASHE|nr:WW domain-binding protein 4 [Fasciola hepatica]
MTDYWKSNPRKFCDVCQCWMADNKISVQNHESGMRHKANVEKKMNELQRSSVNSVKEKQEFQKNLQKINDSAFVGMMKDIARDPSLAKRYGIVLTEEQKLAHKRESQPKNKETGASLPEKPPTQVYCEWREATTPGGQKYYWNAVTKESRWTPPEGVTVAPESLTVKQEKNKLQHFVLNRLVELSESGSTVATAAVHQAFNASVPEASADDNHKPDSITSKWDETVEQQDLPVFRGPKVDLLGQWIPVEDSPQIKMPKLDLPGGKEKRLSCVTNSDQNEDEDSRASVLARLEETTYADIHGSSRLETGEKQLASGAVSSGSVSRNVPRVVFRKRGSGGTGSSSTRNFRTPSTND